MQRTIKKSFSISGIGLHSGAGVSLIFSSAPQNTGIVFIKDGQKILAHEKNVRDTRRGTYLNGVAVVEHLLAAISGLGIDNLYIEVKGVELPVLDGSALPYAEALEAAGRLDQKDGRNPLYLNYPIKVIDGDAYLEALPFHGFKVDFMIDFPGIGKQNFVFTDGPNSFKKEIAPARTFGYLDEYELLKEQGLARGANLENALVLGKDGYINTPRFSDEAVRHKILDLIGDLALIGRPLKADIKAFKSGHKLNLELVRQMLKTEI